MVEDVSLMAVPAFETRVYGTGPSPKPLKMSCQNRLERAVTATPISSHVHIHSLFTVLAAINNDRQCAFSMTFPVSSAAAVVQRHSL